MRPGSNPRRCRMVHRSEPGFTLVEVAIALVVLAVGVLALAGSSAMVTRMIGHGRQIGRAHV